MICEIGTNNGIFALWIALTFSGFISVVILSSIVFYPYYVTPTFTTWQRKTCPKYPSPCLVKKEILLVCRGLPVATIWPAFTLMASKWGWSQGYCGENPHASSLILQAGVILCFSDLFIYLHHLYEHKLTMLWKVHKHHHVFFNPSPFAAIADAQADHFIHTIPLVLLPLMMPINMDLMFAVNATVFYAYGTYLHWGFESTLLTAHNWFLNTSFHHHMHHAVTTKFGRTIYPGFVFNIWDKIFGTTLDTPCVCASCRPRRTEQEWLQTEKPDYSVLLSPQWWWSDHSKVEL